MRTVGRVLLIGALLALFIVFIRWQFRDLSLTSCADVRTYFLQMGWTAPVFILIGFISSSFALIPGTLLAMLCGMIYGWFWGTVLSTLGIASGACLAFAVSRTAAREPVSRLLQNRDWYQRLQHMLNDNGMGFVVLVRLVPIFPFTGLNFACGLLPIRAKDYIIGSLLGIVPGTFAYNYLGHTGCQLVEPLMQGQFRDVSIPVELRWRLGLAFLFLLLISSTPLLWQLRSRRKR